MNNQQTIRQLLTLDTRITQIETLLQSANPDVSLTTIVKPNDFQVLKNEIEILKNNTSTVNSNDFQVLKNEIEILKNNTSTVSQNDMQIVKDEIENIKKATKDITEIDTMIKTNFEETNRKFEEVNKAVISLDANMEKANKIEADVEELKRKVQ